MPYNHFSHKVLKDAIALIQGTNPNFAFDEDGTLRVLKPRWHSSEFNGLMPISTNFSIDRLEVIQAASALLANIAFKQDHSHPISDLLKIKAHPKSEERPGALIQAMYDDIGEFGSGLGMGDDDWRSIDDEMQQPLIPEIKAEPDLSKSLDYLTRCLKAIREGDSITYDHDYEDDYAGTELFEKRVMPYVRYLRTLKSDEEIWRMHNTYPEAVNFYRAAPEAEFLLNQNGVGQEIRDIKSFINSFWPQLAGKLDLKVDPILLRQARQFLAVHPMREPEEVSR